MSAGTGVIPNRRALRVWLVLAALCFLRSVPTPAAEIYLPPQVRLPDEIYTFSDGSVTRRDLLDAVLQAAQPAAGELPKLLQAQPSGFLDFILIDMLAREQNRGEIDEEAGRRLGALVARAGGNDALDANLRRYARPPITRADLYRRIRQGVLAEKTGYAALSAEQLQARFQPRWYGLGSRIVASAAGSDFTRDDLAQYLLLQAGDGELANLLQERIERQILLAEAGKMGLNTLGLDTGQVLRVIFAPLVQDNALREYFEAKRSEFVAYKVREFPVSNQIQAGQSPAVTRKAKQEGDARKRAEDLAEQLRGTADLTPLRSTGILTYYYLIDVPPALVPPSVYGLDYSYNTSGQPAENPLQPAGGKRIEALRAARPGSVAVLEDEIAGNGANQGGAASRYIVVYCEEILQPRLPQRLFPALAVLRLSQQRQRLLGALTAPERSASHWRPEERIGRDLLYPPVPAAQPEATVGDVIPEIMLPEFNEPVYKAPAPVRSPGPASGSVERTNAGAAPAGRQPMQPATPVMPELPAVQAREVPALR